MTTALPSCYWFAFDTAFDAGNYNFTSGSGSPFSALIANPLLYDKVFLDVGPRDPDNADPDTNFFLEYFNRWFTSGQGAAISGAASTSLRSRIIALRAAGKTRSQVQLYLGGIHYSGSTNFATWNATMVSGGGSSSVKKLLGGGGGGNNGNGIKTFLQGMLGWGFDAGEALFDVVLDGTGATTASHTAMIRTVQTLENMGFNVLIEAFAGAGAYFSGYPSVSGSTYAVSQGATFDALPSDNGVFLDGEPPEGAERQAAIATWRNDDRAVYAGWSTVIPGPWEDFDESI